MTNREKWCNYFDSTKIDFEDWCLPNVFFNSAPKPLTTDYVKRIFVDEQEKIVVVKFYDDTIEKVKCSNEDDFDVQVGVAIAIARHIFGSHSCYYKHILGKKITYTKKAELSYYENYIKWCKEHKERLISENTFKKNKAKYLKKMEGEK